MLWEVDIYLIRLVLHVSPETKYIMEKSTARHISLCKAASVIIPPHPHTATLFRNCSQKTVK